jgi:cytochrome oxidase Cu insertion factor (SCO1/SenC/PrrC family)
MFIYRPVSLIIMALVLLTACGNASVAPATAVPTAEVSINTPELPPMWLSVKFTDAVTGKDFTINDFKGKVVVIDLMAAWCPNCLAEQKQLKALRDLVSPDDLVVVTLGTDLYEDAAVLKKYAQDNGFDWRYAVAPLEAMRDIGNLYGALFMDPTLSPTLIVDRQGEIYKMNFGYKKAEDIKEAITPLVKAKP